MPPLEESQHWLLDAITSPSRPDKVDLESRITPGPAQSPEERLAIYRHAYLARLLEVLRELFPCTRCAVGDELFDRLMTDYLRAHPPTSYTLVRLPDQLVAYLDATRPPDWGQFLVELARLEHAIDTVFDGPGEEQLPAFHLPDHASGNLRLVLTTSFKLLAFHYPVSTYYTSWKADNNPDWPDPREQHIALVRRDFIVRRHELTPKQYQVLSNLHSGASIAEAMFALANFGTSLDLQATQVAAWFERWAAEGFFTAAY